MRAILLIPLLLATPALANGPDCGGDAMSSGVVIEHRPPRHGPIVAGPDTLCANVEDVGRAPVGIDVYLGDGGFRPGAPYPGEGGRDPGRRPPPPPPSR